ncbi:MAG: ABC transporter substrate-binding protein [Weeksellaceae bacterium]
MNPQQKKLRYTYWLVSAFVKKNAQAILLSFLLSIIGVISFVSFSPYLFSLFTTQTTKIGISGLYTAETLPDDITSKFSNGMLYVGDNGELIPLLAESWEEVDGGKEYRYHLKKDLSWNDGKPFTAKDIKYNFTDVNVEAQNEYLLVFKLKKPLAIFPTFLAKPVIKKPLVGVAGLYTVDKVKAEAGFIRELQLTPNKDDLPILIYKFYDTETKLIQAYKLGEITEMQTNKANTAEQFKSWKNTVVEEQVDYTKVMTLFYNFSDGLIKEEKDLRHAIAMSIDKSKFEELGENGYSPIPPVSWAHDPTSERFGYNPNLSSKLMQNYVNTDKPLELRISTYYDHLDIADEIKQDLEAAGVTTKVEVLAANLPSNYQLFLAQMTLPKDPDQYFYWHSTQKQGNITNYANVRVDNVLEKGRETLNISERKEIYNDFQQTLIDDMPAYFLYYPNIYTIKRK